MTDAPAIKLAKEIAAFLKEKYGATRVLLFGFQAQGTAGPGSDIDIYFEGLVSDPPAHHQRRSRKAAMSWGHINLRCRYDLSVV